MVRMSGEKSNLLGDLRKLPKKPRRFGIKAYDFIVRVAGVAQLVERHLAKVVVVGSNPITRSFYLGDEPVVWLGTNPDGAILLAGNIAGRPPPFAVPDGIPSELNEILSAND